MLLRIRTQCVCQGCLPRIESVYQSLVGARRGCNTRKSWDGKREVTGKSRKRSAFHVGFFELCQSHAELADPTATRMRDKYLQKRK